MVGKHIFIILLAVYIFSFGNCLVLCFAIFKKIDVPFLGCFVVPSKIWLVTFCYSH